MDKKVAGLLGAVSALVVLDVATATASPAPQPPRSPQSYADLLQPIPNAVAALAASDAAGSQTAPRVEGVQVADHHHHHHHYRHRHHHHYHHHG